MHQEKKKETNPKNTKICKGEGKLWTEAGSSPKLTVLLLAPGRAHCKNPPVHIPSQQQQQDTASTKFAFVMGSPMHFVPPGPKILLQVFGERQQGSMDSLVWPTAGFLLHTAKAQWIGSSSGCPSDEESPDSHYFWGMHLLCAITQGSKLNSH